MSERKPAGVSFESWIDKQIRTAQERGEFDNLPGTGKPLPDLHKPYDENWWVNRLISRENLATDAQLPVSLRLSKEIEQLPEKVATLPTEQVVRALVGKLNERIAEWLRAPTDPYRPIRLVDADEVVAQWRAGRRTPPEAEQAPQRRRWWQRR